MVVARRRRRRRPVLPLLALLVTAIVGAAALARGSSKGPDQRLTWLDAVRPSVERSNQLGLELADLQGQVGRLDRPTLTRRLARLAAEAAGLQQEIARIRPPSGMVAANALLLSSFTIRTEAVRALAPAFDAALGGGPATAAAAQLAAVGRDLGVADRTYQLFLAAVPHYHQPVTVASVWLPNPEPWQPPELASFVASLRSSASLSPVHDVAVVTVATDPPPTGAEGAADVLPLVKSLRLQVVIANVGNERERHVTVLAMLTGPGLPGGQPDTVRQFADLGPGQRATVQLGGLRPVAGQPLTLTVQIPPVPGEVNTADNTVAKAVVFR
jgi:hypothetical protein